MKYFHLLVFIFKILFTTYIRATTVGVITRNATAREALFVRVGTGQVLDSTDIIKTLNVDLKHCALACTNELACRSFNFIKLNCELLSVDRNTVPDGVLFVSKPGWNFYDTGFDITQSVWRTKSLLPLDCPAINPCGHCGCIKEPGTNNFKCDCWALSGKIKHGSYCLRPDTDGCDAQDGIALKFTLNCNAPETDFEFNPETGDLWNKCTTKRICIDGSTAHGQHPRVKSTCPVPQNRQKWILSFIGRLHFGDRCINAHNRQFFEGAISLLWNGCMRSTTMLEFTNAVQGRVKSEFWSSVGSWNNFLHNTIHTSPTYSGWVYNFETVFYYDEHEYTGRRLSAYFISPESGSHTFQVSIDDYVQIWFGKSPSENKMIFQRTKSIGWYNVVSSPVIDLMASTKYYLEVKMYEKASAGFVIVGVTFPSGKKVLPITQKYLIAV